MHAMAQRLVEEYLALAGHFHSYLLPEARQQQKAAPHVHEIQKIYRANFGESRLVRLLCLDFFFKASWACAPLATRRIRMTTSILESSVKNSFARYF
jgi:hypothetical protein